MPANNQIFKPKHMKIAIFHNFMDNVGGAEYVSLILARELNADIFTTNINEEKIKEMGFGTENIHSIGKIPINPPFKQEFAYWKFRKLDLKNNYDFYIIAGDWAMSGAVHNKPNLWYIHSPIREIWDLYKYTRKNTVNFWQRPFFDVWVFFRRIINKRDAEHIQNFVCNSKNVQGRIKKYLDKDAAIINPPSDIEKFYYAKNGDFWLSVNRLSVQKRIEMQLRAFSMLPEEKLIIAGPYEKTKHSLEYVKYCKSIKPENVEIIDEISRKDLIELYANCKGFITTAKDEDYGITPTEAMASGKPVIAPNEGGYKETVLNGQTGILIDDIDENKLAEAIKIVNRDPNSYKDACLRQARKFDTEIFIKKIKESINYK
jgi:glycosyltransferase involved in cell wall biosynthesis